MMFAPSDTTKVKTARELGLTVPYWKGLWEVLRLLEAGTFKQVRRNKLGHYHFNMSHWFERNSCGSIGCMGGWAEFFARDRFNGGSLNALWSMTPEQAEQHARLTTPPNWCERPGRYPPERCAPTLRRYLETGETVW